MTFMQAVTCVSQGDAITLDVWQQHNDPVLIFHRGKLCRWFNKLPYLSPVPFVPSPDDLFTLGWKNSDVTLALPPA